MIAVRSLHKSFGPKVAVDDVSFQAENGQITGLLGPNGAGKTTTLRMLYGLVRPDRGTASIDNDDIASASDPSQVRRALGVLPDAVGLYTRMSTREHLRYSGALQGLRGATLEQAIDRMLDRFEIRQLEHRRTAGFSHGERRKVALARALIHNPTNVMLDEPTNGLDVMSIRIMRRLIRDLAAEGKCVVFSSHVMQEVSALCDRVVIIAAGRVVADGTPAELLASTGRDDLEDAFLDLIGTEEGLN